ncbi:MAG: T9SS type A sorting domain-containing protein [Crocinitomicaceae bacterium]
MIKTYLTFVLLLSFSALFSQTCVNNVNTDPPNAFNNALPANPDALKYLNNFSWFDMSAPYTLTNMYQFNQLPYQTLSNVWVNQYHYYKYITEAPLPLPENGWELLTVNLGRFPDNTTAHTFTNGALSESVYYPYIVLYNRYSGVIRVFLKYVLSNQSASAAIKVNLEFANNQVSGLLRSYRGFEPTLASLTDVTKVSATVDMTNSPNTWASVDFQATYDPCTCSYPSLLKISFRQISSSSVKIFRHDDTPYAGNAGQPIIENVGGLQFVEDFANNVIHPDLNWFPGFAFNEGVNDFINISKSYGLVANKNMYQLIQILLYKTHIFSAHLINNFGQHSKERKLQMAVLRFGKYILNEIMNYGTTINSTILAAAEQAAIAESSVLTTSESDKQFSGISGSNWYDLVKNNRPDILTHINGQRIFNSENLFAEIKTILSKYSRFVNASNLDESSIKSAPTEPISNLLGLNYSGQDESVRDFSSNFFTPGTYGSAGTGSPALTSVANQTPALTYPVYNEVLGTFAVLEAPKVKISSKVIEDSKVNELSYWRMILDGSTNNPRGYVNTQRYQSWQDEYQVQIDGDLKFVINPALDVKSYSIKAGFEIFETYNNDFLNDKGSLADDPKRKSATFSFQDGQGFSNVNSTNTKMTSNSHLLSDGNNFGNYSTNPDIYDSYFSTDWANPVIPDIERDGIKTLHFNTELVPLENFNDFVAGNRILNEFISITNEPVPTANFNNVFSTTQNGQGNTHINVNNLWVLPSEYVAFNLQRTNVSVNLKLVVDIEFNTLNSDGHPNRTTQILTIPISGSNITLVNGSNIVPSPPLVNSSFGNVIFDGTPVEGCALIGTNYECRAINTITISDDIETSNGFTAEFIAGQEINVINESEISPEVILRIDNSTFYDPIFAADPTFVQNFCDGITSGSYKANAPKSSRVNTESENGKVDEKNRKDYVNIDFTLFPNPTNSDIVSLQLIKGAEIDSPIEITMHDLAGKLVNIQSESMGSGMYSIDVSNIAPGTYFVTGSTYGNKVTKRLIVL